VRLPSTVVLGAVSTKFTASGVFEDVEVVPDDVEVPEVAVPLLVLLELLEVRVMLPVQSGLTV
jgi:hypothetical protein